MKYPQENPATPADKATVLRLPADLLKKLTRVAANNNRSRNGEIVRRLGESLANDQTQKESATPAD